MANSEIDDIFSGTVSRPVGGSSKAKGKSKAIDEPAAPSTTSLTNKKKAKKRKQHDMGDKDASSAAPPKLTASESESKDGSEKKAKLKRPRVVETVRDPSAASIPSHLPKPPNLKTKTKSKLSKGESVEDRLDRFRDSRGSGPRKKTEEGFLVFKEDELGIRDEGGDTPLCPFDCNCCF